MDVQISQILKSLFAVDVAVVMTRPDPQFGDYATNIALQLAKQLGKNPREIAEQIAEELRALDDYVEVTIAGPGFINIRLSDAALMQALHTQPRRSNEGQSLVLEYSCPNAFKELHTGHLYQTIFGDILARILETSGAAIHRTSFGGDVGLHVAKCLWGMREALGGAYPEKLADISGDVFERSRWISGCYVSGAAAYEADPTAKDDIDELNKTIYGWHNTADHQSPLAKIYWETRQWSFDYFDAFYKTIEVAPLRYYPESTTAPTGLTVVHEQLAKGNLKESNGAVVFEGDESKHLHTRVFVTSKGLPTYETKDIGVIWQEKADYDFDHRILITGNDQKEYMRVVFAAAETFRPELIGTMTHLTNGLVRFGDGTKMSSRLGNVTRAVDVIDTVREKVRELVSDPELVEPVTLGAIKYVFAKYKFGGDIAFDVEETVSLQGNSGPYLQYAHARARSILTKSELSPVTPTSLEVDERALVQKLSEYPEIIERTVEEYAPHALCQYLYELAQEFNRFYEKNRIIGHEREAERLALVGVYADRLRDGLRLLGVATPNKL